MTIAMRVFRRVSISSYSVLAKFFQLQPFSFCGDPANWPRTRSEFHRVRLKTHSHRVAPMMELARTNRSMTVGKTRSSSRRGKPMFQICRFRPSSAMALTVTLGVVLTGCNQSVNLDAVRALAASAAASQATFNSLAADYGDSCVRRNIYSSIGAAVETNFPRNALPSPVAKPAVTPSGTQSPVSDIDIASLPPDMLAPKITVDVAKAMTQGRLLLLLQRNDSALILTKLSPDVIAALNVSPGQAPDVDATHACDLPMAAARAWQNANGVVIAYFVALGKLAGGVPASDSYGVKALGTAVVASKGLSKDQGDAIGAFANDVLDQIYEARRRGALADYIPKADAALGGAITTLQGLATDSYANSLSRERIVANRFFQRNLQMAQPGEQAFEVLSYADAWSTRTKDIDDKAAAIKAYVSAWDTLRSNHAKLLTAISNNDASSALAVAQAIYAAITPDIGTIEKAFTKGK